MSHPSEVDENPAGFLNVIAAVTFLGAVSVLIALFVMAPKAPPVTEESFNPPLSVDADRLEAEREKRFGDVDLDAAKEEVEQLHEAARQLYSSEFGGDAAARRSAYNAVAFAANDVMTAVGMDGYMAAGETMFDACREGLDELRAAVKAGEISSEEAALDPGDRFDTYRENCGAAWGELTKKKVIEPDGDWSDPDVGPHILELSNRYRWATVLDLRLPRHRQFTPYELEVFTRWRVGHRDFPFERRKAWAALLEESNPAAAQELLGNLAFEARDLASTLTHYRAACDLAPKDVSLRARCEWLEAKANAP